MAFHTRLSSRHLAWPLALFSLAALPSLPAHAADKAAAEACAGKLEPEAKTIYDAAAPQITPSTDMRDLLKTVTFSLMMQGEVKASDARPAATAAAGCLRNLK